MTYCTPIMTYSTHTQLMNAVFERLHPFMQTLIDAGAYVEIVLGLPKNFLCSLTSAGPRGGHVCVYKHCLFLGAMFVFINVFI